MTIKTLRSEGASQFTPETFNSLCSQIDNFKLSCTFLVYGFDGAKRPHLFTVENPGITAVYDKPGFWAIGSGTPSALTMLFYRGQSINTPFADTVYNVCEAKFMSESASDVGKDTFFYIKKYGFRAVSYRSGLFEEIRKAWDVSGKPRIPKGILERISDAGITFSVDSSQKAE